MYLGCKALKRLEETILMLHDSFFYLFIHSFYTDNYMILEGLRKLLDFANWKTFVKTKVHWCVLVFTFMLFRLPSLWETKWYGDEGIYAAVAQQMNNGGILYVDTWDHKPPGIFYIYWLVEFLQGNFVGDYMFYLRLINFIFGIATSIVLLLLVIRIVKTQLKFIPQHRYMLFFSFIAFLISYLIGSVYLEGNILNAENIFILFTVLGYYVLFTRKNYYWISVLLGLALLFKIHPIFDLIALVVSIFIIHFKFHGRSFIQDIWVNLQAHIGFYLRLILIALVPLFLWANVYVIQGYGQEFFDSVFFFNSSYSSAYQSQAIDFIFIENTLISRVIISTFIIILSLWLFYKKHISNILAIIIVWNVLTFFAATLSNRPYVHYLIQTIPSFILLLTYISSLVFFSKLDFKLKISSILISVLSFYLALNIFFHGNKIGWGYVGSGYYPVFYSDLAPILKDKTDSEWVNVLSWTGNEYLRYFSFLDESNGDRSTIEKNINEKKVSDWNINGSSMFIWANVPWVYEEFNINNPSQFVVPFHVGDDNIEILENELLKNKPQYILLDKNLSVPQELETIINNYYEIHKQSDSIVLYIII